MKAIFAAAVVLAFLARPVAAQPNNPPDHPTPHEHPTPPEHPTPHGRPTPVDCSTMSDQIQTATANCSCDAQNHGQYVRCVAQALNQVSVPPQCLHTVRSCAAKSTCGRPGFVTCQRQKSGVCDTASGTCRVGTSATGTCAANTDCVRTKCTIMSSADRCSAAGGIPGSGSCCAPEPLSQAPQTPEPTPTETPTP
jgi:hypothetical protein